MAGLVYLERERRQEDTSSASQHVSIVVGQNKKKEEEEVLVSSSSSSSSRESRVEKVNKGVANIFHFGGMYLCDFHELPLCASQLWHAEFPHYPDLRFAQKKNEEI